MGMVRHMVGNAAQKYRLQSIQSPASALAGCTEHLEPSEASRIWLNMMGFLSH